MPPAPVPGHNLPARPWLDGNKLALTETGKIRWTPVVNFATHGVQASWSRQVIKALREAHPEVFPETALEEVARRPQIFNLGLSIMYLRILCCFKKSL